MENDSHESEKAKAAREILAYLADHADAQDTLEGIVQWWLLERKIRYQTVLVKEALAELTEKGFVLECKINDSQQCYRLVHKP